jgi:hypothetical protein
MGRAYAGILGPLAFGLVCARGVLAASGTEATLVAAMSALFIFAGIGYLAGQMADYLVRESVRTQFQSAMAVWEQNKTQPQSIT